MIESRLRCGYVRDAHTRVYALSSTVLEADFDDISELMPEEEVARAFLSNPMFFIAVSNKNQNVKKPTTVVGNAGTLGTQTPIYGGTQKQPDLLILP